MAGAPLLDLDGYTDLPAGKVATVVTYLEMRTRPRLKRVSPAGRRLERLNGDPERYRTLFRRVGEDWLWFSRAAMPEETLRAVLCDPKVEAYALVEGGADIALMELAFRPRRDVEIAYFGLVPEAIGTGAGRYLMNAAIRRAFRSPIRRVFVHTCTLDHPGALAFYRRSGFIPYRLAIEVADDPRLRGVLPATAAPQIPLITPGRTRPGRKAPPEAAPREA
jgi:GNAT superfamily N-acetyltransferase